MVCTQPLPPRSDDCGESGSGKRLQKLLEDMAPLSDSYLVAVTRWYGGASLGPKRFRVITGAAKDLISDAQPASK
jgi:hypothetical protein